ncbi:MAG: LysM peptidoglycan-binding domain-containing protein [Actinomycetota bacterium]|nr:LysM peptidoglycan-binding domain-containing protein [Actinomycetota bacterium]
MALAAPFPAAARSDRSRSDRSRQAVPRSTSRRSTERLSSAASAGLRLTARGRLALILASVAFLALAIMASARFTAEASAAFGTTGPATAIVVVQPGETLWQIAQTVAPQVDPRETVGTIRELNGLGHEAVQPGQSIVVPASS